MSDVYGEFGADAEEALDVLLAQHQSSLTATVGPALDVSAGLRRASSGASVAMSFGVDLTDRDVTWVISFKAFGNQPQLRLSDCEEALFFAQSSALNGVLHAIRYEAEQLESLAGRISEKCAAAASLWGTEAPVVDAVRQARDELNRIQVRLCGGEVTKESVTSEFALAVRLLEEQHASWRAADAEDEQRRDVAWVEENLSVRLGALMRLRDLVVRLFEDSNACAFQLS
ncbi:hypothetical protein [Streptomyces sp. NPDC088707]|uniref:hypothetical protein n=1 Tax=Streptomyces sp. NPDC088707 TaxID=3365871 RepID=UPI00382FDF1E